MCVHYVNLISNAYINKILQTVVSLTIRYVEKFSLFIKRN